MIVYEGTPYSPMEINPTRCLTIRGVFEAGARVLQTFSSCKPITINFNADGTLLASTCASLVTMVHNTCHSAIQIHEAARAQNLEFKQ